MNLAISLHTSELKMKHTYHYKNVLTGLKRPNLFMAKCFIDSRKLSQAEWLNMRKQGIGSADCAAACGVNSAMTMFELWKLKTGRIQQSIEVEREYAALFWDKQLETFASNFYRKRVHQKIQYVNAILQHQDPEKYFMFANLDYTVIGSGAAQILNCIVTDKYEVLRWESGVPLDVQCQVQHQLAVTGKNAADICVLLDGYDTRVFQVQRNERMIESIILAETYFWNCVEWNIPPDEDIAHQIADELNELCI